ALGAVESAGALRLRQTLEVAERLEQQNLQPVVAHQPAGVARRAIEGEEIVLEDLDAVEAGGRDGGQLLGEIAADRYRCDGRAHALSRSQPAGPAPASARLRRSRAASAARPENICQASTPWWKN